MCAVRSCDVIEAFPCVGFCFRIDVAFVPEKLVALLLMGPVGSLGFAVQLRCAPFDAGVPGPGVFNMPMELGLEFVAIIRTDFTNAEWERFDDVVNEVNRVCLGMLLVDHEGAAFGCIVDCRILEATDLFAAFPYERQELDMHLNVMVRHLLLIAFGVQFVHARAARKAVQAVAFEHAVDPAI